MVGGKLRWRDATTAAVRTYLVEVAPPIGDDLASLDQRREPVFIEAFIAELAVEALDVAVLHGFAGFDQDVFDAMLLCPSDEGAAGELRAVVRAHRAGIAAEAGDLLQHTHHVGPADAMVHRDVNAFMGEVVGDGQALDAAATGQLVEDEVHADYLVGMPRWPQLLPLCRRELGLLATAHAQLRLAVQTVDPLVVHLRKLRAQQVVQAAIAEATTRLRQFDQPGRQGLRRRRGPRRVAESIAGDPRKATSPALADRRQLAHAPDCLALALRG